MAAKDPKILIIGCGISGISAALRLFKAGFRHVRILEATENTGGRIKTAKLGNTITEIGATYIHGPSEENPLFCLARDYGLLDPQALTPENQTMDVYEYPPWVGNWFSSSGQKLSAESMDPALEMFLELMYDTNPSEIDKECASVGHFIRSQAQLRTAEKWKDKDETTRQLLLCALSTMLKFECCASATPSMDEIDLAGFSVYKDLKGVDCTFPSGYESLIQNLMSELPADLVTYNCPVRCVHWNGKESGENTVTVECADGKRIAADHVIVTVPLGYLKKHHSTLFCPPLPAHKLHSIQKIGFGTTDKIYVEFESPWWDADCEVIYLVWKDEEDISDRVSDISKSWIRKISVFTVIKPSESHILCGWISGHEAEYMERLPEHEVRRSITEFVHTFTGNSAITPKRILCSRWFSDPWTCGSYCHLAIGCSAQDLENMMEPLPAKGDKSQPLQVLFAGEATHPCYYSSVHGALLTGWREADRLITHYSSVSPCGDSNQKL
ncbi:peroxisomal N(1)-acetyl-spermine/spermidine oxidase-like [Amphiprion ocellaris]|uniref:Amine oxidase domain-containing protein n=1 Tax=Amphiprion ocellaris TaxID=80972 RepID=A0A3Q1CQZ3_AMPOC|nr:peroxisomal N(1)-acetyl-spermine/spermidine oxidase-like [Amphiprion ocellaris]